MLSSSGGQPGAMAKAWVALGASVSVSQLLIAVPGTDSFIWKPVTERQALNFILVVYQ